MTEYDYSPEAVDAYVQKQVKISKWVDNTLRHPQANPYTPATPAVRAHHIRLDEEDRRHRRRDSKDSKYGDREDRTRDRHIDVDASRHHRSTSPKSAKNRKRSASYSATTTVLPDSARSRHLPPPLPLGPHPNGYMSNSKQSSPTSAYPYPWGPPKFSPRDSKHSSRTSSSTLLPTASNMHLQNVPHSAPVVPRNVVRSHTTPAYGYPQLHPAYQSGSMGYLPVQLAPPIPCHNCPDPKFCLFM